MHAITNEITNGGNAFRYTPTAMEAFTRALKLDKENPMTAAYDMWFRQQRNEKGDAFTCSLPFNITMGPELSSFANAMARDVWCIEMYMGVAVFHQEIQMLMMSSLANGLACGEKTPFHILFSGGPGKSAILDVVQRLSVPRVIERVPDVSDGRARSNAYSGMTVLFDEGNFAQDGNYTIMAKEVLGELGFIAQAAKTANKSGKKIVFDELTTDGTDDAKTMLTKGVKISEMDAEDTKHRKCIKFMFGKEEDTDANTAKCQFAGTTSMFGALYNCPKMIPYHQRVFYVRDCPSYQRDGFDTSLHELEQSENQGLIHGAKEFTYRWQLTSCLANMLCLMIRLKLVPPVDKEVLVLTASNTFMFVHHKTKIHVDTQAQKRILMYAEALTIYAAIQEVFFSGKILPAGVPFEYSQLLLCAPFLVTTKEMFYFALGSMSDILPRPPKDTTELFTRLSVTQVLKDAIGATLTKFQPETMLTGRTYRKDVCDERGFKTTCPYLFETLTVVDRDAGGDYYVENLLYEGVGVRAMFSNEHPLDAVGTKRIKVTYDEDKEATSKYMAKHELRPPVYLERPLVLGEFEGQYAGRWLAENQMDVSLKVPIIRE